MESISSLHDVRGERESPWERLGLTRARATMAIDGRTFEEEGFNACAWLNGEIAERLARNAGSSGVAHAGSADDQVAEFLAELEVKMELVANDLDANVEELARKAHAQLPSARKELQALQQRTGAMQKQVRHPPPARPVSSPRHSPTSTHSLSLPPRFPPSFGKRTNSRTDFACLTFVFLVRCRVLACVRSLTPADPVPGGQSEQHAELRRVHYGKHPARGQVRWVEREPGRGRGSLPLAIALRSAP